MIKNVCVIGSNGQIGHSLSRFLKNKQYNVLELDITTGHDCAENAFFNVDVLKDIDYVFFLAFDVGGSLYLKKYQNTFNFIGNNIRLMDNVFKVLNKTKTPFIFTSSQMANMNYSPYGVLKSIGEFYTKSLNSLIVKFWNVYGIEHDLEKSHVITDFIHKAYKTGVIDMETNGMESRQFLYADDCSEALEQIMLNHNMIDRTKNLHVTSFEWSTILNIAQIISSKISCTIKPSTNTDNVQLNLKNEPDDYILKFWNPKTKLQDGIYSLINHYSYINQDK